MRVHVLQHVPFEGLGAIQAWLDARGASARGADASARGAAVSVTWTRFFEDSTLPAPEEVDFVIALGGPMSVNDESELPWLRDEKRFVREVIAAGKAVLGVCLGAQLIASSLGCRVYPGLDKEIGWFPIEGLDTPSGVFSFPHTTEVFHWHGETFDLPAGSFHLARSPACENQAFQLGERVVGLQFHLEMTDVNIQSIAKHCHGDLFTTSTYVQSESEIHTLSATRITKTFPLLQSLLDYLTRGLS